jgi:hypothetical protein
VTPIFTVIFMTVRNGRAGGTSSGAWSQSAHLPLSHSDVQELREQAIERHLRDPDLRAHGFRRADVRVEAFYVLAANRGGEIKNLRAGDMP